MTPIIPSDSPSIYAALNTLQFQDARLALVRPKDPPPGVAGYLFDIVDEDSVEIESDITDHYIEDNTAVQDQIALRPETITVRGTVAEIVLYDPKFAPVQRPVLNDRGQYAQQAIQTGVSILATRLPLVGALVPQLASYWAQQQAEVDTNFLIQQQRLADANSLYGRYIQDVPLQSDQTNQSRIFGYFYQLWKGRQFFSVETPWGFFNSMVIQSLSVSQGASTRYASEFTVTFKKLRVAQAINLVQGQLAGRAADQRAAVTLNSNVAARTYTATETDKFLAKATPFAFP